MIVASIYGRLGKDAEARTTRNNNEMAFTSIAVDATPFGAEQQETLWLRVTAFGKVAETLARHQKGDLVSVSGKVSLNRWTAADGAEREQLQIIADQVISARTVRPGGRKAKSNGSRDDYSSSHRAQAPAGGAPFDDEISF
jgi:single-strand DNA-binding protein